MLFIAAVPATVSSRTDNRWTSTSTVAAFNRTVAVSSCCREALCSLERICYDDLRAAKMRRLVTTVSTWNDCVAKLVLRQTFAWSARESIRRTSSRFTEVALFFIFSIRTLNLSVTESCFWDAFSTSMTLECLLWTVRCYICIFGHWKCAFFIGSIL